MAHILLLHEGEQPTVMSLDETLKRFCEKCDSRIKRQFAIKCTKEEMDWADVVVCVRGESPRTYSLLRYAKESGKKVMFFLDDDLKDIPKQAFRFPGRKKWLIRCIQQCSLIWTSNQLMVDEYKEFVNEHRGVIMHTAVNDNEIITVPNDSERLRIVYAASQGHMNNFKQNIAPFLPQLFFEYGERIELYFIGIHPQIDLGEYNSQIFFVDGMPLDDYYTYMRTHHFDVGLAPLMPTHFTERKYFNKYIEYSKMGICGVYSDVMPYKLAIKDGWNGYMTENTPDAWLATLRKVLDDNEGRNKVIKNAQEHLRTEHNEEQIFSKLMMDLPELVNYISVKKETNWPLYIKTYFVMHVFFRVRERMYLTCYSLTHFGFKTTMRKICGKFTHKR